MKTKPHAKALAEAARIVGFPMNLSMNSTKDVLLCFCGYCEDWMAERFNGFTLVHFIEDVWGVERGSTRLADHKLRHIALARAVLAVNKQETAK